MDDLTRRSFLGKSLAIGAGVGSLSWLNNSTAHAAAPQPVKDDISIAQWALVSEIRSGKWTNLDFPQIARDVFDINGIEFVNTLFELPTYSYLKKLKSNAEKYKVKMVLVMVDDEGETCDPSPQERMQAVVNHHKWIDIAKFLGCHSVRTNCRGPMDAPRQQALAWAAESYNRMLEYAAPKEIKICIENHGGWSNDADWMVDLIKKVNHPYFGSYPDWRSPGPGFDNVDYLKKMLPYAVGLSYRNQPTEELTAMMIKMCQDAGYRGWYGIESSGRDGIKQGKELLKKYLKI
ncbi:MAG: TIM barrel protein [Planctomycetes bacterium]|nr:TIM barrel protein [Planctomycetota bacterium]